MPRYVGYGLLLVVMSVVGCSSSGTQYVPIKTIPEGQALVYIFYPENNSRHKSPNFVISISGQSITKLKEGGYYPYFAKPGELTLTSKLSFKYGTSGLLDVALAPKNDVQLKIDRGQTYYLEGVPFPGTTMGTWEMKLNQIMDDFQAQLMLEKCKLLQ